MPAAPPKPRLRLVALPELAVAGAVLGTAWDQLHVAAGTLIYSKPAFLDQAWWVPLEFALVYALGALGVTWLGDPAPSRHSLRMVGGEIVWFTALYATTAFFHASPWAVAAALVVALGIRASTLRTLVAANPLPALAIVALGPLTESVLIGAGLFRYAESQLGNIPVWLPLLWANAIPFAIRLSEAALLLGGVRRPAPPRDAERAA